MPSSTRHAVAKLAESVENDLHVLSLHLQLLRYVADQQGLPADQRYRRPRRPRPDGAADLAPPD